MKNKKKEQQKRGGREKGGRRKEEKKGRKQREKKEGEESSGGKPPWFSLPQRRREEKQKDINNRWGNNRKEDVRDSKEGNLKGLERGGENLQGSPFTHFFFLKKERNREKQGDLTRKREGKERKEVVDHTLVRVDEVASQLS